MNQDEKIAERYLKGAGEVEFEPDGNIPPDFLVNNRVAVEVRRLNQNHRSQNIVKGLEEDEIPFIKAIEKELKYFPAKIGDKCFWLFIRYRRPFGNLNEIKKSLKAAVDNFESNGEILHSSYQLSKNVEIEIGAEAIIADDYTCKYSLGIFNDFDSGGWVIDRYSTEIDHCSAEKSQKIISHIRKYTEWWLVLVDHLSYIAPSDAKKILELVTKPNSFQKIIVINAKSEVVLEF